MRDLLLSALDRTAQVLDQPDSHLSRQLHENSAAIRRVAASFDMPGCLEATNMTNRCAKRHIRRDAGRRHTDTYAIGLADQQIEQDQPLWGAACDIDKVALSMLGLKK